MLNSVTKLYRAFINSYQGLKYAYQTQWAFRLELIILIIAIPLAFFISNQLLERVLMVSSVLLLPLIELLNSAIETTVNRISIEYHPLSGYAKDLASAAMLFAIINALAIWIMIIWAEIL